MKKYILEENVARAILNYLANMPYREVFELVTILQKLPELPNEPLKKE